MPHRFPKRWRLRKRREFLAVQQAPRGRRATGHYFVAIACRREPGREGRVGVTVSKNVGSAVVRNRIKRWVREVIRQQPDWIPPGKDTVVIARRCAAELRARRQVVQDLEGLAEQLKC